MEALQCIQMKHGRFNLVYNPCYFHPHLPKVKHYNASPWMLAPPPAPSLLNQISHCSCPNCLSWNRQVYSVWCVTLTLSLLLKKTTFWHLYLFFNFPRVCLGQEVGRRKGNLWIFILKKQKQTCWCYGLCVTEVHVYTKQSSPDGAATLIYRPATSQYSPTRVCLLLSPFTWNSAHAISVWILDVPCNYNRGPSGISQTQADLLKNAPAVNTDTEEST